MNVPRALSESPVLRPLVLVAFVLALYLPFLRAPFVFDDFGYIVDNPVVANPLLLLDKERLGQSDVVGNVSLHGRTRALGLASFWLTHALWGDSPAAHRVLSIAVHAANACLLYALILLAFRTPRLRGSALAPRAPAVAWVAAALFALHPLATGAVIFLSQRFTSLCALFYLSALAAYAASRQRQDSRPGSMLFVLSVLLALCASFTKENAATLPLAIALYEGCFHEGPRRARAARLIPYALVAMIIPLILIANTALPLRDAVKKAGTTNVIMSRSRYTATELGVFLTFLRLTALPVNQNLDYDYPAAKTLREPRALAGLAALLLVLGGAASALVLAGRGRDPVLRLAAFGLAWVPLSLIVESGPVPLTDAIAEHRFYLSLAGAACAASALGALALRMRPRAVRAALAALLLALAALTLARGAIWMSAEALWRDAARKSPGKQRPLAALGDTLLGEGRNEEALAVFSAGMALGDPGADLLCSMGIVQGRLGRPDLAQAYYENAITEDPSFAAPYYNLGLLYEADNRAVLAEEKMRKFLEIKPSVARAHEHLGHALFMQGRYAEAADEYRAALALDPGIMEAHFALAETLTALGDPVGAAKHYRAADEPK